MQKNTIYSIKSPYRQSMDIVGYTFGADGKKAAEKSCCIVGALRGTEIQQMAICAQLVDTLKRLEGEGRIAEGKSVTVIPCVNYYSMNIGKRFWTMDNTDINRMFPGFDSGETTQRIADGLFEGIKDYAFGVHLTTFYQEGQFLPHVKVMEVGGAAPEYAQSLADFGLPYGLIRKPRPYDTATLNYNWQVWGCRAFSLFTTDTQQSDGAANQAGASAVLRFLAANGIVSHNLHKGSHTRIINEDNLEHVNAKAVGLMKRYVSVGDEVSRGTLLCEITHPLEGHVLERVTSPVDGIIFFLHNKQLVMERTDIFKIVLGE